MIASYRGIESGMAGPWTADASSYGGPFRVIAGFLIYVRSTPESGHANIDAPGHKPTSLGRRESNTLSSEHIRVNKKALKPKAWLR